MDFVQPNSMMIYRFSKFQSYSSRLTKKIIPDFRSIFLLIMLMIEQLLFEMKRKTNHNKQSHTQGNQDFPQEIGF